MDKKRMIIDDLIRSVGRIAYNAGLPLTSNPYKSEDTRALWIEGWRAAEKLWIEDWCEETTDETP